MIICPGDDVPAPSEKSGILQKILQFIMIFQILLALSKITVSYAYTISQFISVIILYSAYSQLSYCNCVIYIFICQMNAFIIFVDFATLIQNKVDVLSNIEMQRFILYVYLASFIFYVVAIYFGFLAYKQFKGIAFDILNATNNDSIFGSPHFTDFHSGEQSRKNQGPIRGRSSIQMNTIDI